MTEHRYTTDADDLLTRIRAIGAEESAREQRLQQRGRLHEGYTARHEHAQRLEQLAILMFALDTHFTGGGPLPREWATPGDATAR